MITTIKDAIARGDLSALDTFSGYCSGCEELPASPSGSTIKRIAPQEDDPKLINIDFEFSDGKQASGSLGARTEEGERILKLIAKSASVLIGKTYEEFLQFEVS
jgi:hypothetical protein